MTDPMIKTGKSTGEGIAGGAQSVGQGVAGGAQTAGSTVLDGAKGAGGYVGGLFGGGKTEEKAEVK